MMPNRKNAAWDWCLHQWLLHKLQHRFHTIHVRGLANLQTIAADRPTVAFSNHTNQWDPSLVFFLAQQARHKDFYCMMEESQLQQSRFLTRLGAFAIDLKSPIRAAAAVRYAMRLLQSPSHLIWVFPQGEMASPRIKVKAKPGIEHLAKQASHAQMLPVAFRYEFFRKEKPEALIEIGAPFPATALTEARAQEECQRQVDKLERAVLLEDLTGFVPLLPPLVTPYQKWKRMRRALAAKFIAKPTLTPPTR